MQQSGHPHGQANFALRKCPGTHSVRGSVTPSVGLKILDKLRFKSAQNNYEIYGVNVYATNCFFLERSRNKIFKIIGTYTQLWRLRIKNSSAHKILKPDFCIF